MEIRLRSNGQIVTEGEFRRLNAGTSFPAILTESLLASFNADPVLNGAQPVATRYQMVVRQGVEQIGGKWFTKFVAVDMDADAKAALDAQHAASIRAERNRRIAAADWTQLPDSPVNKAAWAAYRQSLRDVPTQAGFPWDINWPAEPTA